MIPIRLAVPVRTIVNCFGVGWWRVGRRSDAGKVWATRQCKRRNVNQNVPTGEVGRGTWWAVSVVVSMVHRRRDNACERRCDAIVAAPYK